MMARKVLAIVEPRDLEVIAAALLDLLFIRAREWIILRKVKCAARVKDEWIADWNLCSGFGHVGQVLLDIL